MAGCGVNLLSEVDKVDRVDKVDKERVVHPYQQFDFIFFYPTSDQNQQLPYQSWDAIDK